MVIEDRVQLPRSYYTWPTVKLFAPDDAALDVLASVLASGKNSRLYKRLVYGQQDAPRYDRVTQADVQRVARTYLGKPKIVLTVVPEGKKEMMVTGNGGDR